MTVDRIVHLVAGLMVLAGIALSYAVHPYWLGLSVFVGLNLAQSGLTNFCPLAFMLKKAGVRERLLLLSAPGRGARWPPPAQGAPTSWPPVPAAGSAGSRARRDRPPSANRRRPPS